MGLGKTLSSLALICSTLDFLEDESQTSSASPSRATLVVTPKSSECLQFSR